jgi:hypothetical protein
MTRHHPESERTDGVAETVDAVLGGVLGGASEATLVLVDGGDRHVDSAPSEVGIGVVRPTGWQIHPLATPASFAGAQAYLLKINYELVLEPEVPAPGWFEVGFRFTDAWTKKDAPVLDVLPRTTFESCAPAAYSVGGYLNFVPAPAGAAEAVDLPALRPFIDVFGLGSPAVRWRYSAPRTVGDRVGGRVGGRDGGRAGVAPGSRVSWIIVLVPEGCAELRVEVSARYDMDPESALGLEPETREGEFVLTLTASSQDRALVEGRARSLDGAAPGGDTPYEVIGRELPAAADDPASPRVFVSYAHDNERHREAVRAFCEFLVHCGIDVHMDRWDLDRRRDWGHWALEQVRAADFILAVASPMFRRVGDGEIGNTQHRGLQSELAVVRDLVQTDRAKWLPKVLPVVLPGGSVEDIPMFLQPWTADHFEVAGLTLEGADDLLRVLTGQPPFERPVGPGRPVRLPPRTAAYWAQGEVAGY